MRKALDKGENSKYNNFTETVKWVIWMKRDYTIMQLEQLAKEQLCKAILEVPFVSDVEVFSTGLQRGFGDFGVRVYFSDSEEVLTLFGEVKSRGEKRFVSVFALEASQYLNDNCYIFMAPYISEQSAEFLRSRKLSYMDLSGNCYILTKRIILAVSGRPNAFLKAVAQKNYFSKSATAASTIMRTMLQDHRKSWMVKELAEMTGKSIGAVSNVRSFLLDHEWAEKQTTGFRLHNIEEMLRAWSVDYQKKSSLTAEYYTIDSLPELEQGIGQWNKIHGGQAVLGGFAAAARYAPTVRYNKLLVYVEQQDVDEFVKDMGLKAVDTGGNITLVIPHDETPCLFSRGISDALVTSPTQTVIDLLSGGGRGEEAAHAIIQKEFKS